MPTDWPTARELMTPQPTTLPTEAPLSRAIGIMRSRSFHEIPILRGKRLVGMITFESIARRSNLPLSTKVEHLMLLPPMITGTTTYPELAEQLLAAGLRGAPVVGKKGELVGIVSRTDLVKRIPDFPTIAASGVAQIASPVGQIVKENDTVGHLFGQIRLLEEHPLPVVDRKGRLTGAVGVADLGRVLWRPTVGGHKDAAKGGNVFDVEVATIMHSPALTVPKTARAADAAKLMTREKVSSVFVVEDGKPVGVVSQADLLSLAIGSGEAATNVGDVYVQIHGLRGSGDPSIVAEIDRVVAKGLRHIARHARPMLLSLNVTPQGTHRTGDATVHARLNTDRGIFYATHSGWNFFAGIADLMDELENQVRRAGDERTDRKHRRSIKEVPPDDAPVDPDLEARIRSATQDE